jgi:phosphatidylinositol-3-phosphatase
MAPLNMLKKSALHLTLLCSLLVTSTFLITGTRASTRSTSLGSVHHVFLIMFENHSWSDIFGSTSAPYLNGTVLPQSSYATNYFDVHDGHPSLAAYVELEAGTTFGIANDGSPSQDHQATTAHLTTQLTTACPLVQVNQYTPRHNATVYFDDTTGKNNSKSAYCIAHERPIAQLSNDLSKNTTPNYSYIIPDLCHNMHTACPKYGPDLIKTGDTWLSQELSLITASPTYKADGAVFITWDEGTDAPNGADSDGPVGMILLSPFARGSGYTNALAYTHASTLRTIEEIFNLPLLGDAQAATDLSDLFR